MKKLLLALLFAFILTTPSYASMTLEVDDELIGPAEYLNFQNGPLVSKRAGGNGYNLDFSAVTGTIPMKFEKGLAIETPVANDQIVIYKARYAWIANNLAGCIEPDANTSADTALISFWDCSDDGDSQVRIGRLLVTADQESDSSLTGYTVANDHWIMVFVDSIGGNPTQLTPQIDGTEAGGSGGGGETGDSVKVDGVDVVDPDFVSTGDIDFINTANTVTANVNANAVALGTDTTGNYVATIADSGASEVTVTGSGSETAAVTLALASGITRDTEWNGIDFLVGTATSALSSEIVAGTTPGGELGGTWASPTIDDNAVSYNDLADSRTMTDNFTATTATYTVLTTDQFISGSGTFTLTLPTAVGVKGKIYTFKNIGTGVLTIDGNASETIDGATTYTISTTGSGIKIISDNSNWLVCGVF